MTGSYIYIYISIYKFNFDGGLNSALKSTADRTVTSESHNSLNIEGDFKPKYYSLSLTHTHTHKHIYI